MRARITRNAGIQSQAAAPVRAALLSRFDCFGKTTPLSRAGVLEAADIDFFLSLKRSIPEHMIDEKLRSVQLVNTVSIGAWDSPGGAVYGNECPGRLH